MTMQNTEILVDGAAFWDRLEQDIANARESVCIQTLTFEGDATGRKLADAMLASRAPDRRILIDCFNLHFQSDCFVHRSRNRRRTSPIRREAEATASMIEELRD